MALGTYPEPHSATPGGDYVLREQVPHGDLNQLVTNQRTIWNAVKAVPSATIETGALGDGAHVATLSASTSTTLVDVAYSTTLLATSLTVGQLVTCTMGPFLVINTGGGAAGISVVGVEDALGASSPHTMSGGEIVIPASSTLAVTIACYRTIGTAGRFQIKLMAKAYTSGNITVTAMSDDFFHGIYRAEKAL